MKPKKVIKWIVTNPMEIIAAVTLVISIVITTVNALTRYILRWTWNPATDLTTLCFGYTVFCGAAAAYKRKMHYGIDLLISKLPEKVKTVVNIATHVIVLAALIYATYLSIDLVAHVGGKIMTNTKISYRWFDFSAVLGFGYMAVYELLQTLEDIKIMKGNREVEA